MDASQGSHWILQFWGGGYSEEWRIWILSDYLRILRIFWRIDSLELIRDKQRKQGFVAAEKQLKDNFCGTALNEVWSSFRVTIARLQLQQQCAFRAILPPRNETERKKSHINHLFLPGRSPETNGLIPAVTARKKYRGAAESGRSISRSGGSGSGVLSGGDLALSLVRRVLCCGGRPWEDGTQRGQILMNKKKESLQFIAKLSPFFHTYKAETWI